MSTKKVVGQIIEGSIDTLKGTVDFKAFKGLTAGTPLYLDGKGGLMACPLVVIPKEYAYRYEECRRKHYDEHERPTYSSVELQELKYEVLKRTPKGIWIDQYPWNRRFVLLDTTNKKFACLTKEEALQEFLERKRRHLHFLTQKVAMVQCAVSIAEGKLNPGEGLI